MHWNLFTRKCAVSLKQTFFLEWLLLCVSGKQVLRETCTPRRGLVFVLGAERFRMGLFVCLFFLKLLLILLVVLYLWEHYTQESIQCFQGL